MGQTIMRLDNIYVQEFNNPDNFKILLCNAPKRNINSESYFNLGFFSASKDGKTTEPIGNLCVDGKVICQTSTIGWTNLNKKQVSTIYFADTLKIERRDTLTNIPNLKWAVSGIPIIRNSFRVDMIDVKKEGWDGSELYDTWHGFLGIRNGKLVYVAMKCAFSAMVWNLVALGIYDAIKVDGGGSFMIKDEDLIIATTGNRRISNVGLF